MSPTEDKEKIAEIVKKIGGEYYSHSFPITRRDVEQELKLKVERPSADLFSKIWSLYEYYRAIFAVQQDLQMNIEQKDANGVVKNKSILPITIKILGFIESEAERRVLIQLQTIRTEAGNIKKEPIYSGWVKPSGEELPDTSPIYFSGQPEKPILKQTPSA